MVNVGGSCGEGCSPLMKRMSVGGVIVLGARESRVQGEAAIRSLEMVHAPRMRDMDR